MAVDRNKITDVVNKYVQRGQYKKAIRELERIAQEDPNDVRTLQRIAELHARDNNLAASVKTYSEVADVYVAGGFFAKAVAVYKQILRITPDDLDFKLRLANLHYQLGLVSDAMVNLDQVAQAHLNAGRTGAYISTLVRMVDWDPDNVGNRIRLAEQYAKDERIADAVAEFGTAAGLLYRAGRYDEFSKVAERLLHYAPDDALRLRQLSRVLLDQKKPKRALPRIQALFKLDAHDEEALQLLIDCLVSLGEQDRAITVLRDLAQGYRDEKRPDLERKAWQRLVQLAPNDAEGRQALGMTATPRPTAATAQGVRSSAPTSPGAGEPDASKSDPARMLAEVDVFLKYNLYDRALGHLRELLRVDPNNLAAIEKKKDIHIAQGQEQLAVRELVKLARARFATERVLSMAHIVEADNLIPGNLEVRDFLDEVEAQEAASRRNQATTEAPVVEAPVVEAPAVAPEAPHGFAELDNLLGGVATEAPGGGQSAIDNDQELLGQIGSSLDQSGIAQRGRVPTDVSGNLVVALGTDDFLPDKLDDALTHVATLVNEGQVEEARNVLFELLGEWPEHAELLLVRMDQLPSVQAAPPNDDWADSPSVLALQSVGAGVQPAADYDDSAHDDLFMTDEDVAPSSTSHANVQPAYQPSAPEPQNPAGFAPAAAPRASGNLPAVTEEAVEDDDVELVVEHPVGTAVEPAVDAPVGRASSAVDYLLSLSAIELEDRPDSHLAQAIRERLAGNGMVAMLTLQDELSGSSAVLASFENALCAMDVGLYFEAATALEQLLYVEGLEDTDYLLIRYFLGVTYEALDQTERATTLLEFVRQHAPDAFPDIMIRIHRMAM